MTGGNLRPRWKDPLYVLGFASGAVLFLFFVAVFLPIGISIFDAIRSLPSGTIAALVMGVSLIIGFGHRISVLERRVDELQRSEADAAEARSDARRLQGP